MTDEDMNSALILFGIVSFFVGLPILFYLAIPLLIKSMMSMNLTSDPVPLKEEDFQDWHREYLLKYEADLEAINYLLLGRFTTPELTPNVNSVFSLLLHEDGLNAAMVVLILPDDGVEPFGYVELVADTQDGRNLNTLNSPNMSGPGDLSTKLTFRVPWILDIGHLDRLHRLSVAHELNGSMLKPIPTDQPPGIWMMGELRENMEKKLPIGHWKRVAPNVYRLTLVGAYLHTWAELWPFKTIRKARDEKWARNRQAMLERSL